VVLAIRDSESRSRFNWLYETDRLQGVVVLFYSAVIAELLVQLYVPRGLALINPGEIVRRDSGASISLRWLDPALSVTEI